MTLNSRMKSAEQVDARCLMALIIHKKYSSKIVLSIFMISAILNLLSCSKTSFSPEANSSLANPVLFENTYKSQSSEVQYSQANAAENQIGRAHV